MIGKQIKRAREASYLSLDELSTKIGTDQTTISKYESDLETPDSTMLLKLAKALEVRSSFFFKKDNLTPEDIEYYQNDSDFEERVLRAVLAREISQSKGAELLDMTVRAFFYKYIKTGE